MLPIGALCTVNGATATLLAQVVSPDGETMLTEQVEGIASLRPETLGERAATLLIQRGALELLPDPLLSTAEGERVSR